MKTSIPVLMASLMVGCSSGMLATHGKNDAELATVRKVALVGYDVYQPKPRIGMSESSHVEPMYDAIHARLKVLGYKVTSKADMLKQPFYQASYKNHMEGFQNKNPPPEETDKLLAKDVFDTDTLRIMGLSGRDNLIQNLGVDALVEAHVMIGKAGTKIMGFGPTHIVTRMYYRMFKKGVEEPIWFETLEGEESKESVGATALFDRALLAKLGQQSLNEALAKWQK